LKKLELNALRVHSFLTTDLADRLQGGAAARDERLEVDLKPNNSLMDCPSEPVICPP